MARQDRLDPKSLDDLNSGTESSGRLTKFTSDITSTGLLLLAGHTISTVILTLAIIIVARLLGPDDYGLYSLVLLTPTFLTFVIDLGLPTAIMHFSAKSHSERDKESTDLSIITALTVGIMVGLAFTASSVLLSSFISSAVISRPGTETLVTLGSLILAPQVVFTLTSQFFASIGLPKYNAGISIAMAITKGFIQVSLVLLGYSVAGAVAGHVFGTLIAALMGIILLALKIRPNKLIAVDWALLKKMLLYGLPFYICVFLYQGILQYEGILMGEFATDAQVGNHKTAYNFMFILTMTVAPLSATFVPAFSRFDPERDRSLLCGLFRRSIKYASLMTIPFAVGMMALSGDGVYAFFGDQYELAPLYLSLMALHAVFSPLGANVIANSFNGLGKSHYVLAVNGVWTIAYVMFARSVMVQFGLPGLILLFTVSWIPGVLVGLMIADRKFGMRLDLSWSLRTYLAAAISGLAAWGAAAYMPLGRGWPNLTLGVPILLMSFFSLSPLLGIIDKEDVAQMERISRGSGALKGALAAFVRYERALISLSPFR